MIDSLLRGDSSTVPLNLSGLLLALGLTFVAGQLIAWVYVFTADLRRLDGASRVTGLKAEEESEL